MRGCQVPLDGPRQPSIPHRMALFATRETLLSRIEHTILQVFFLHRKHRRVCAPGLPELRMDEG